MAETNATGFSHREEDGIAHRLDEDGTGVLAESQVVSVSLRVSHATHIAHAALVSCLAHVASLSEPLNVPFAPQSLLHLSSKVLVYLRDIALCGVLHRGAVTTGRKFELCASSK